MAAGDAQLRFEVLGPLRVRRDGEVLSLGGPKPRALLGTLLLHPGQPIGVDQLTEALWDGEPPASAATNLRAYVRTLRRTLDGAGATGDARLQTSAPGYLIRVEPGELDLLDFQDMEARGRAALERGDTGAAARLWRRALDLWRGRPLDDIRGGPRLNAAVVRLEERRLRVAEAWIDAQLALGGHAELVSELRGMVTAAPLHEPLWARLIVALHRAGRTADALAAFGQAREQLVEELGVEPGPQLQRLQRAILSGDAVTLVDETPADGARPPPLEIHDSTSAIVADVCPYQGLMPFETADAEWFFGRERLVAELATSLSSQLTPPTMLAVVGPSGSGKSSLLRAGLLPALAEGLLPAARDWPSVVFTPGARPLVALSTAIASVQIPGATAPEPDDLVEPQRLRALVRRAFGPTPGRRTVMVVDQLEELFMVCKDERERQAFVIALRHLAGGGHDDTDEQPAPAVVVFGLRADFYGHCIAYPDLIPVLAGGQVVVGPMTADELRHAIARPATRAGLTLESGLMDVLLADIGVDPTNVRPEPGSLPLLSHALLATWQLRDGHRLTLEGYRKAGGVHGAIAATAEAVYDRLEPGERIIVRQLFTRLVALGEGTQDTSRRIRQAELFDGRAEGDAIKLREVLDALAQARLIVLGSDTVELAHEALITRWPRLQQWLTEDGEGLRIHRALTENAQEWEALGRDAGALYRGARLTIARQWAAHGDHRNDMNTLEQAFLDASVELESDDEAAVRHRTLRSRQLVVVIVALLLLAVAGGAFALWQARRSAAQQRAVRSQELARTALDLPAARRPTAMLLAVEAYRTAPTGHARGALAALAPQNGYMDTLPATGPWVNAVTFSPDGRILAEANRDGTVTLWDHARRTRLTTLSAPGGAPTRAVAFSPDGRILASGHMQGTVVLWDVAGRARLATLTTDDVAVHSLAFSPDGSILAGGTAHGALLLWDPDERDRLATLTAGKAERTDPDLPPPSVEVAVAFSPDGSILATGSGSGALVLWDPAERSRLATLRPDDYERFSPVHGVAFSPDGETLAAAHPPDTEAPEGNAAARSVTLWDVDERIPTATVGPQIETASTLAFSPDGDRLAAGTTDGVVVSDVSRGPPVTTLRYGGAAVSTLAFSPDGGTLAVDDSGEAITLVDPSSAQIITDGTIERFAVSPDGSRLATAAEDIELWDTATERHVVTFDDPGYRVGDVAFAPDGEWVGRGGWDSVTLHHVRGERRRTLPTSERPGTSENALVGAGGPRSIGFSEDPWRMFVADDHHQTVLVRPRDGSGSVTNVPRLMTATLSPAGDVLATASASGVTLWEFPRMTRLGALGTFERFETEPLMAFSEDGSTLATVDGDLVTLWDVDERAPITSFAEDAAPNDIDIAPDNRTVALGIEAMGADRIALWDAVERVRFAELPVTAVTQLAFHDDGTALAAVTRDRIVFWDLDAQRATTRICSTLDRGLAREEWAELLPREPYRATCAS